MKKKIPTEYLQYLTKESNLEADQQSATGIPLRGILIGAVLAFLINFLDVYCTLMIRGSYLTLNFSTPAALFFFFILVLASGLVALIRRPLALTQTELITIYIMMIVSCCVPSMGLTPVLLPQLVGPIYYATPENDWAEVYNQFIPNWLIPQGEDVARYFYEGLPQGAPIPWEPWVVPLAYWYGFFLSLCLVMTFAMIILRKQWADREKLVYPLVQVPMEMIQQERKSIIGKSFFTNKAMWVAFAFSFMLISINGLHSYSPSFPSIERDFRLPIFRDTVTLWFSFSPSWLGFFYFVGLDISASIWVFHTLTLIQKGIFNVVGIQSTERIDHYARDTYTSHQGMGAMIVFVLIMLWGTREHLGDVFRKALGRAPEIDDSGEVVSYRQAVLGLFGSLLLFGFGLWVSGLPLLGTLMFIFSAMVIFLSLTRVVTEGGVPAMRPPVMSSTFVISGGGTQVLGASGLVALGFSYGWHSEIRSFVMASVANGLKMSEIIRGSKRRLFWAVVIAIVVSLIGSTYMVLYLAYKYGGINLNPLFFGWKGGIGPTDMAPRIVAEPTGPRLDAWLFMGIGGAVMAGLMWVRHQALWWPLSPLGYLISANWKTSHIYASVVLAWFLKLVILRYGGPKLYRNLRPFFLGLILGEIVAAGVWLVIDYFTGHMDSFLTQV